jgi:hypothetical protein
MRQTADSLLPSPGCRYPNRIGLWQWTRRKQTGLRCYTPSARFLAWRRQHPVLVRGWLEPLDLAEPLVGFVREFEDERILALFNLSDSAVTESVAPFGALQPLPESGCAAEIQGDAIQLPPFGTFFAGMTPIGVASPKPELATAS